MTLPVVDTVVLEELSSIHTLYPTIPRVHVACTVNTFTCVSVPGLSR